MHSLPVIKDACIKALGTMKTNPRWREPYCLLVDPTSVLVMAEALEKQNALEHTVAAEDVQRLGQLARDLTDYVIRTGEPEADPAREELLARARLLLLRFGM